MKRVDVTFASGREHCAAWFYLPPAGSGSAPCIVMAHGLGGTRDAGIEPFAEAFQAAGYAVLLFDYRGFGGSGGKVRQLINPRRQLDDWAAAIAHARTLPGVDPARIALWGTSFSGGHVIAAAARDGAVAAVSSQCPMLDGWASLMVSVRVAGVLANLRMGVLGVIDMLRTAIGLRPILIPLAAPVGQLAFMATTDAFSGYRRLWPPGFINGGAARLALLIASYRPGTALPKLRCPTHVIICDEDTVAPASASLAMLERAGSNVEVKRYPVGHFDVYVEAGLGRALADQLAFFARHLSV